MILIYKIAGSIAIGTPNKKKNPSGKWNKNNTGDYYYDFLNLYRKKSMKYKWDKWLTRYFQNVVHVFNEKEPEY